MVNGHFPVEFRHWVELIEHVPAFVLDHDALTRTKKKKSEVDSRSGLHAALKSPFDLSKDRNDFLTSRAVFQAVDVILTNDVVVPEEFPQVATVLSCSWSVFNRLDGVACVDFPDDTVVSGSSKKDGNGVVGVEVHGL